MASKNKHLFSSNRFFRSFRSQKNQLKKGRSEKAVWDDYQVEIVKMVEQIYHFSKAEALFFEQNLFLGPEENVYKKISVYQCEQDWLEASPLKLPREKI